MSGIAGVYHLDGRPVGEELDRMTDALEHRGPDGANTWRDGSVGLGHLMLETTPEDQYESLPLVDRSGNFAITADARIDNRDELIKSLDVRDPDDRPITDTELILAAYKRWGRDCPKELLGAFAFAVWNDRESTLTLVRDHFGIRPLSYVHRSRRFFTFASLETAHIRAGLSGGDVNDRKIADFLLVPTRIEPGETYWEDVFAVPPAHTVQIDSEGEVTQRQYWALDPERETSLDSDQAYIERFQELFREAVKCRMRSSTPQGAMLSGGLDSTSIACTAAEILRGKDSQLHTLSATFDSIPEANERDYQEVALRKYNGVMEPTFFRADETSPFLHLSRLIRHMGRPCEGVNSYVLTELYSRASDQGCRVVLDGYDGDTTVSHGRAYHNELLWSWQWGELWEDIQASLNTHGGGQEAKRQIFRGWMKYYLRQNSLTRPWVKAWRWVRGSRDSGQNKKLKTKNSGKSWRRGTWRRYFKNDFLNRIEVSSEEKDSRRRWRKERHHHHMMITRPMMESTLRAFDGKSSAAGVEVRFPFFDVRLVEYCLSLPGELKRRAGWDRWIERSSMSETLPKKVQWRKSKPNVISSYVKGFLRHDRDAFYKFSRSLSEGDLDIDKYLSKDLISQLASKMASGNLANLDQEGQRTLLWRAISLQEWLETVPFGSSRNSQRVSCGV